MEKNLPQKEIVPPLHYTEEYYPDWGYNPSELLRLAVRHKKPLSEEAVGKIKKAIDNVLGKDGRPGQWKLDKHEFDNLVKGYAQCQTIPDELEDGLIEIIKLYKRPQAEGE